MNGNALLPVAGSWRHSFEEDADNLRVYRRADFAFPRARGRAGMDLLAGGKFIDRPFGAGDAPAEVQGRWHLDPGSRLVIETPQRPARAFDVVACTADRLIVREHT